MPPTQPLIPPRVLPEAQAVITEALLRERQVEIQYRKLRATKDTTYRVHPLALVQRGPMLYLYCHYLDNEEPRTLAMSRITAATLLDEAAVYPKGFSLDERVEAGVWGFGAGKKIAIELLFDPDCGAHLLESLLSKDQQVEEMDGGRLKITATVADTLQLRWWLRGFGADVEVISPPSLRSELAATALSVHQRYTAK